MPLQGANPTPSFGGFGLKDVVELVGLSKTTIWRRMRAGEFPPAIRLGGPSTRAVGWKVTDVEAWLEQRRAT